ncbi:MAG: hypothetical protein QXF31_03290, partial [Candidatus Bathyarchaeia archaeon]
ISSLRDEWRSLLEERISLERERAKYNVEFSRYHEIMDSLKGLLNEGERNIRDILRFAVTIDKGEIEPNIISEGAKSRWLETANAIENLSRLFDTLKSRIGEVEDLAEISSIKLANIETSLLDVKDEMFKVERRLNDLINVLIEDKVKLALLSYQRSELLSEIEILEKNLSASLSSLGEAVKRAEEKGSRVATLRSPEEILDEIRIIDGRLMAMADISEDVEKMYESYSKLYLELKERARIAAENREKTLREIRVRMEEWRGVIKNLLESVNTEYQNILSHVAGSGFVRLINENDIEAAGLEIYVGFKGSQPVPLNIYSQSGGERSTATMAFLLALQKHIKSPFRAVDEYDVHMDPRNREVIANMLISAVKNEGVQYIAITPNQMFFEGKDVHVITVQNVDGKSLIREVV